jgi:hypothetical protein
MVVMATVVDGDGGDGDGCGWRRWWMATVVDGDGGGWRRWLGDSGEYRGDGGGW